MKIYVLTAGFDYEGDFVVGAYATEADAKAAASKLWGDCDWAPVNRYPLPCIEGRCLGSAMGFALRAGATLPDTTCVYAIEVGAEPQW